MSTAAGTGATKQLRIECPAARRWTTVSFRTWASWKADRPLVLGMCQTEAAWVAMGAMQAR